MDQLNDSIENISVDFSVFRQSLHRSVISFVKKKRSPRFLIDGVNDFTFQSRYSGLTFPYSDNLTQESISL